VSVWSHLEPAELEALLRKPEVGEVAKERIRAELASRNGEHRDDMPLKKSRGRPHVPTPYVLEAPLHLVVSWACIASDNDHVGIIGKANRERRRRYVQALAAFRARLQEQYSGPPTSGPVAVDALIYFPDERARDCMNIGKILGDALKGVIVTDDRWKVVRDARQRAGGIDRDEPRVEITVTPLEQQDAA
jgi:Holliday junction resolvase RusA-like endonuclease